MLGSDCVANLNNSLKRVRYGRKIEKLQILFRFQDQTCDIVRIYGKPCVDNGQHVGLLTLIPKVGHVRVEIGLRLCDCSKCQHEDCQCCIHLISVCLGELFSSLIEKSVYLKSIKKIRGKLFVFNEGFCSFNGQLF